MVTWFFFFSFWLQLGASQLHTHPILMGEASCHQQLAMVLTYNINSTFMRWPVLQAPALGAIWNNNCLHQSWGQSWCIFHLTTLATDPKKKKGLLQAMKLGGEKREYFCWSTKPKIDNLTYDFSPVKCNDIFSLNFQTERLWVLFLALFCVILLL